MSKWSMLRKHLGKLAKDEIQKPDTKPIEPEIVETTTEAVNEAFKISVNITKLSRLSTSSNYLKSFQRSLDEARARYQLHEKKALTKPTGFYENKLEMLTDIIISYERTQQEKTRRLQQLQQSMSPNEVNELNELLKRHQTVSHVSTRTSKSAPSPKLSQLSMKSSTLTESGSIIAACE